MSNERDESSMLGVLVGILSGDSPLSENIIKQEKNGQASLKESTRLPVNIDQDLKEMLIREGFTFPTFVSQGELFQPVGFPDGWHIKATDHDLWSVLVDLQGRERASIF